MYFIKGIYFLFKNFFKSLNKLYFDLFFPPFDPNKPMPKNGIFALNDVVKILNKLKISYFITDGTILGLYRDKTLIAHDNDIDIALIDNTKLLKFFFNLIKSGWIPMRLLIKDFHIYQLIFHKDKIILDFLNWKRSENKVFFLCPEVNGIRRQDMKFYNPTIFEINNMRYYSHSNLEEWLEIHYGGNWHIPKNFKSDWREETKDIMR